MKDRPQAEKADDGGDKWDELQARFLETSDAFFNDAMELGVSNAEKILQRDTTPAVTKKLQDSLQQQVDQNAEYVEQSLFADLKDGKYESDDADKAAELEGELDDRVGMYANELYRTAIEGFAKPVFGAGVLMEWELDPVAEHCDECPTLADGGPYSDPDDPTEGAPALPTFPGDTPCMGNCRCKLVFDQESWDAYVHGSGIDQT